MKKQLINQYKNILLNIYAKEDIIHCPYDYILVCKDLKEPYVDNHILLTTYQDFYNNYQLKYPIPPIRKPRKLLTYQQSMEIIKKINYGTLVIPASIPYCVSLNHFVVDNHIYFHTGKNGYKLNCINQLCLFQVINDLGIHEEAFTHNHQSVHVYGILKEVKENKKALLEAFLQRYTPHFTKEINSSMIENTMLLELDVYHINGKRHFH